MSYNESAMRYVKKVSDNPEMAHNKIIARIKDGSSVLEFGSASGAMTRKLHNEKKCEVSIVEIDKEAYDEAIKYATFGVCCDIQSFEWEENLKGRKFDFILFVDVLEHLTKAEEVLRRCKAFLNDGGSILISVPNGAHNSVILQLLQNNLVYQDTGLLDYSHVHQYAFSELQRIIQGAGFESTYIDATYISVGKNEFDVSYKDIDWEIAEYLRKRPLGEVYQFIFEIKKKEFVEENGLQLEDCLGADQNIDYTDYSIDDEWPAKKIVANLVGEPNKFFTKNNEIQRLRLFINDMFNSIPELEDRTFLTQKVFAYQEEVREKNRHIRILQNEISDKDKAISRLREDVSESQREKDEIKKETLDLNAQNLNAIEQLSDNNERLLKINEELSNNNSSLSEHNRNLAKENENLTDKIAVLSEKNGFLFEKNEFLTDKNDELLKEKESLIAKNEDINKEKEKLINTNEYITKEKEDLQGRNEELAKEKECLISRNEGLAKEKEDLQCRNGELQGRNEELAREKEDLLFRNEELTKENQENSTTIADLKQTVLNKEGHIELLLEVERAYERDKNTKSYKFAKFFGNIPEALFPTGTKRRFFVRVFKRCITHPSFIIKVLNPGRISRYFKALKEGGMDEVNHHYDLIIEAENHDKIDASSLDVVPVSDNGESKSIEAYEKLVIEEFNDPEVSIVIPVYNQFDYTYNCIQSIQKQSGDVTYEIIIGDDCSTDLTERINEVISGIKVIRNENNLRFLLNCNNAAKYAKGKYILFLNNDTQVQENWLRPLIDLMKDESVGMVGSKLVYSDGRLQEAGGILWKDGSAWNYGNKMNPDDTEYNYVKEVDYISGAAIMIRKTLWKEIGGFDERFVPAYCEDSDLAFEVRKHGYKVLYQPLSVVVHFEGVSNGTDLSSGQKQYQVVNSQKFYEKWKDVLEKDHFPNAENVFMARDRSKDKPVLLMVDHYTPQFDKDAGSRTVYAYLKLFLAKGFNVKFIGDNFYMDPVYTTAIEQLGIEVLYGYYYSQHWQDWIKDNGQYIDYVFLNRPHISVKYIDFIRENTKAKIMYYGHDLHFLREYREYELNGDKEKLKSSEEWKVKELDLINKADVVYYPSQVEIDEVKKIAPNADAKAIVAYMYDDVGERVYDYNARKDIMFIGGFGHPPNEDGIMWFLKEVFPKVQKAIPNMNFYIMGSNPTDNVKAMASEHVKVLGFVTDEELAERYNSCRISVVPLRVGAGIKGKVIEAMKFGIPVVTTTIGAEGILGAENILCVEDNPNKMAKRLVALYNNKKELKSKSSMSYKYIMNNYSYEGAWKVIKNDFK